MSDGQRGNGHTAASIRRQVGGPLERDPDTQLWVIPFEVVCPECGDDGGPFDQQPPAVQEIRGPYAGPSEALDALAEHQAG
jgi:hypothetical protein